MPVATNIEKYREAVTELNRLYDDGELDRESFMRLYRQADESLTDDDKVLIMPFCQLADFDWLRELGHPV